MTPKTIAIETPLVIAHGEKIAALSEGQISLERAMTNLTNTVTRMADTLSGELVSNREATHREIAGVKDLMAAIRQPNYGIWIAAGVAIGTLVIALLTPIWSGIHTIESLDTALRQDLEAHKQLPIHPVAAQMLTDTEKFAAAMRVADRELLDTKLANMREVFELKLKLNANKP